LKSLVQTLFEENETMKDGDDKSSNRTEGQKSRIVISQNERATNKILKHNQTCIYIEETSSEDDDDDD
jgi:hypothetical protein